MNKEQQELLDEAYKNYRDKNHILYKDTAWTQEEFINKCKTDPEFSERWGLKIEERELNDEERYNLLSDTEKRNFIIALIPGVKYGEEVKYTLDTFYKHIPTKLITITYNNKTIESYE